MPPLDLTASGFFGAPEADQPTRATRIAPSLCGPRGILIPPSFHLFHSSCLLLLAPLCAGVPFALRPVWLYLATFFSTPIDSLLCWLRARRGCNEELSKARARRGLLTCAAHGKKPARGNPALRRPERRVCCQLNAVRLQVDVRTCVVHGGPIPGRHCSDLARRFNVFAQFVRDSQHLAEPNLDLAPCGLGRLELGRNAAAELEPVVALLWASTLAGGHSSWPSPRPEAYLVQWWLCELSQAPLSIWQ